MAHLDIHALREIARKHSLSVPDEVPVTWRGATSSVYPVGEAVIKIALDRPDAIASVRTDAAMNGVARELGVRTPALLAFDDERAILPVPYAIYERVVNAEQLGTSSLSIESTRSAWEDVGRDLALVHRVASDAGMPIYLRRFEQSPEVDPRPWVHELAAEGALDPLDAEWLSRLLDLLAPAALAPGLQRLCHGDVNASNVLVDRRDGHYRALIDWAGAGWLDPAWDFAAVPLDVVPQLLTGHRAVAPLPNDETAELRILWCQIQTRLYAARSTSDRAAAATSLTRDLGQIRACTASQAWMDRPGCGQAPDR
jgi:hygromycin-B 7''-O-kinase